MKILIIEDEERIGQTLKAGLTQEKYLVTHALDGSDGYLEAATGNYDLILLDLMLPGMDGISICKRLRAENIETPILMLTAKAQLEDKVTGLDAGADDYLPKPFSFDELLARVRALLRRPKGTLQTILGIDDLSLDRTSFEVIRGGKPLALTGREYAILEYLLLNKNKVLTKDQIINNVWDQDSDVLPNTVEVNIRNLRKKVDLPFRNKHSLIQTVRGFGYRISQ
jgi:two-component system, OmpR family, response regulator